MKIRKPRSAALLLSASFLASHAVAADRRYEWEAVSNASYYEGAIKQGGQEVKIRTSSTWITIGDAESVTLNAYDENGKALGPVSIHEGAAPHAAAPAPAPVPTPAPAPAPEPEAEAAPSEEEAPPSEEKEAPPPVAEEREMGAFTGRASAQLGMGKEWLKASGGISDYDGSASVGGTILRAEFGPNNEPWNIDLALAAHNFTTETKEQVTGAATSSTKESKLLRLAMRAGYFYDLDGKAPNADHRLVVGGGLAYERMPLLAITDGSTGAAELQNKAFIALYLGIDDSVRLSPLTTVGARAELTPMAFSGVKAMAYNLYPYWRYGFSPVLDTELGLMMAHEQASASISCPGVTGCSSTSKSTSTLFQARVGIGYKW